MKRLMFALIIFFTATGFCFAQGTMVQSLPESPGEDTSTVRIVFSFVADAATGAVPATAITVDNLKTVGGMWLFKVLTIPGTGTAPTSGWDIEILETRSGGTYDVMGGALVDRSSTATEKAVPLVSNVGQVFGAFVECNEPWSVSVANVGNSAEGTIELYFIR